MAVVQSVDTRLAALGAVAVAFQQIIGWVRKAEMVAERPKKDSGAPAMPGGGMGGMGGMDY